MFPRYHWSWKTLLCLKINLVAVLFCFTAGSVNASSELVTDVEAFRRAISLQKMGRLAEADIILSVLERQSDDVLVLLEVARNYYQYDETAKAKRLFDRLLNYPNLTRLTKLKIETFLSTIEKRKGSWDYAFTLGSKKNPNLQPSSGTYLILGIPFEVQNVENETIYGIQHMPSFTKQSPTGWTHNLILSIEDYEGTYGDNNIYRYVASNRDMQQKEYTELSVQNQQRSGYQRTEFTFKGGIDFAVKDAVSSSDIGVTKISHTNETVFDGARVAASTSTKHKFLSANISPKLSLSQTNYASKPDSFDAHTISLNLDKSLKDISISSTLSKSRNRFHEDEPFFGKARLDHSNNAQLSICLHLISLWGYSPCVSVARNERRSNIDYYSSKSSSISLFVMK